MSCRRRINHENLKKACAEVLGLDESDDDVFLDKVDFINVPERYALEFHLKDGTVVTKTARTRDTRLLDG